MKLTKSDIKRFQSMYVEHFNEEIAEDEARAELTLLVRQLELTYRPLKISELDKVFGIEPKGRN